jgi:hypothetical protein
MPVTLVYVRSSGQSGKHSLDLTLTGSGHRTCMWQLVSRLVIGHVLVRSAGDISSARPNFVGPLRAAAVKGGRRPSRSDLPLTVASTAADSLDRREIGRVPLSFGGSALATMTIPRGACLQALDIVPQTCIRPIREDRNHDAVMRIGGEAPRRRAHSKPRLEGHSARRDIDQRLPRSPSGSIPHDVNA